MIWTNRLPRRSDRSMDSRKRTATTTNLNDSFSAKQGLLAALLALNVAVAAN
jgi:hypothetical protein